MWVHQDPNTHKETHRMEPVTCIVLAALCFYTSYILGPGSC